MIGKYKLIGGLSRKAKLNITVVIILLFIIIIVFASVNQIKQIVEKRKEITELEERLDWQRNENIELLATEKNLYEDEGIELEARKQFNMAYENEENFTVIVEDDTDLGVNFRTRQEYAENDLWGNIKLFYDQQISN